MPSSVQQSPARRPTASPPKVKLNVPARPASVPPPQVDVADRDVPSLIAEIDSGLLTLKSNAAGYASLSRAADDATQEPPILSWGASFNGCMIEVQTDLVALEDEDRDPVLTALINLHGHQLLDSAKSLYKTMGTLVEALEASQSSLTVEDEKHEDVIDQE